MKYRVQPTQVEKLMRDEDFIVSKTDLKGAITYGNRIFQEFSGYPEKELLRAPHNIIRHPDMPRGVFKFLWSQLADGNEVIAYVKNLAADGSYYWVLATVTPSYDAAGKVIGYYSVRRAPGREAVKTMAGVYQLMLAEEAKVATKDQCDASINLLTSVLASKGVSYADFVLAL